jgi:hypothetical protein
MIATDSHSRSTRSSWCEEKTTGTPPAASSRSTPLRTSTPTGRARERLVEHQQLRVVDERGAELHALLVAERERLDAVAGAVGDPEPLEPAVRRPPARRRARAVQRAR